MAYLVAQMVCPFLIVSTYSIYYSFGAITNISQVLAAVAMGSETDDGTVISCKSSSVRT